MCSDRKLENLDFKGEKFLLDLDGCGVVTDDVDISFKAKWHLKTSILGNIQLILETENFIGDITNIRNWHR